MAKYCHSEFGCDCTEPRVDLCDGCVDGKGYIWPIASNGDTSHAWVERCDSCERFDSDEEAAEYIRKRLWIMGATAEAGSAVPAGVSSTHFYIDKVRAS